MKDKPRESNKRYRRYSGSDSDSETGYASDKTVNDIDDNEAKYGTQENDDVEPSSNETGPLAEWERLQNSQDGKGPPSELTVHQRILLPTRLKGYALKHKLWSEFTLLNGNSL